MLSAVVLPERGAMNAVMVSSQDANRAGPRPAGRLRSPSSSPVSAAGRRPRIGPGQRRAEPDGGPRGRDRCQRRDLRVAGERGDRVAGPGDARGDDPPRDGPGRDDRARQHGGDQRDQDGGRAGPRLAGTPAGQADDPPFAERGHAPPARAAAIRAASQASQAAAARPQPISSTTQTPAPLPARSGTCGVVCPPHGVRAPRGGAAAARQSG